MGVFGLSKGGLIFGTAVVLFVILVQCTYDLNLALMSPCVEFTLWVSLGILSSDLCSAYIFAEGKE